MALQLRFVSRPVGAAGGVLPVLLVLSVISAGRGAAPAPLDALPAALTHTLRPLAEVPRHEAPTPDLPALAADDARRERDGLPPRFAVPSATALTPDNAGVWEPLDAQRQLWRLRIAAPGAVSLNLGFTQFRLPKGGRLGLYPASDPASAVTFTDADNEEHGQLWTPVVPGDDLVVELTLHATTLADYKLEIGSVNVGYRDFGRIAPDKSGTCNIDVVCPEGDPWRDEIRSVGVISTGGSTFCTGFMVNNTAQDAKPYFMTANHCGITALNAPSLVVYWNFESPTCGLQGGGSLADFQTGSFFRATYATSDFTLVELDDAPAPAWNVTFAGWDRTAADPTRATAIHHPSTDEKSISFENDPLQTTTYLSTVSPGDGTHLRVVDWDLGTTEPGSSGSPLFDQNHHVVGQLHGGYAACGNNESDWYGRFSVSWAGGGAERIASEQLARPAQYRPDDAQSVCAVRGRPAGPAGRRPGRRGTAGGAVHARLARLHPDQSRHDRSCLAGEPRRQLGHRQPRQRNHSGRRRGVGDRGAERLHRGAARGGLGRHGQFRQRNRPPRGPAAPGVGPGRQSHAGLRLAARHQPRLDDGGAVGLRRSPGRGRLLRSSRPDVGSHRHERARVQSGRHLRQRSARDAPDEPGARLQRDALGHPALLALARGRAAGV